MLVIKAVHHHDVSRTNIALVTDGTGRFFVHDAKGYGTSSVKVSI